MIQKVILLRYKVTIYTILFFTSHTYENKSLLSKPPTDFNLMDIEFYLCHVFQDSLDLSVGNNKKKKNS